MVQSGVEWSSVIEAIASRVTLRFRWPALQWPASQSVSQCCLHRLSAPRARVKNGQWQTPLASVLFSAAPRPCLLAACLPVWSDCPHARLPGCLHRPAPPKISQLGSQGRAAQPSRDLQLTRRSHRHRTPSSSTLADIAISTILINPPPPQPPILIIQTRCCFLSAIQRSLLDCDGKRITLS